MFKTLLRALLLNPFEQILQKARKKKSKKFLLAWNRGLGDIALGLYAMNRRIREVIPDAEVSFLIRKNLEEGFQLFEGVKYLVAPDWERGKAYDVKRTLHQLGIDPISFDVIIEAPNPTYWVKWQLGKVTPKMRWQKKWETLYQEFDLEETWTYIGVHLHAETKYGEWRNWPDYRWEELFQLLEEKKHIRLILFGYEKSSEISHSNVIDFRGKTNLFQILSIIKNRCSAFIGIDSGLLSMIYYLEENFPIKILSLWADPRHGILKQNVASPNDLLEHCPIIGKYKSLASVTAEEVLAKLNYIPFCPLDPISDDEKIGMEALKKGKAACVIMAAGQGTRFGYPKAKGLFPIFNNKSLFAIFCDKIRSISSSLPVAIMCSPSNKEEILQFFKESNNFGLTRIYFFTQTELPVDGDALLVPDGNGALYPCFYTTLYPDFVAMGIEYLFVIPVDNPLAHPFHPTLLGFHIRHQNEVTVIAVKPKNSLEKIGKILSFHGKMKIVEYLHEGCFFNKAFGNSNLFCFSLSFIRKAAAVDLPYHKIKKTVNGKVIYKKEKFIFDALFLAEKSSAMRYPRERCFAPLKDQKSIEEVQKLCMSDI